MNYQTFLKLVVATALAFSVFACSDDTSPEPTPSDDGGQNNTAGTKAGTGGESGTGGKAGTDGKAGEGGTGGDEDDGGITDAGPMLDVDANRPDECFDETTHCFKTDVCEPTAEEHYLNSCTEATCTEFDNSTLTKLGTGGALPAIP